MENQFVYAIRIIETGEILHLGNVYYASEKYCRLTCTLWNQNPAHSRAKVVKFKLVEME